MKSNYLTSGTDYAKASRAVAKAEIDKIVQERRPACQQFVANQVAAVMCKALAIRYGFGKQRLETIIRDTENLFSLCAIDGKRFNAVQAVEWLRDAMGIDLNKGE